MSERMSVSEDAADGLPALEAGGWCKEKHERLERYLLTTAPVRRKFTCGKGGSAFLDLYCGPGRLLIGQTQELVDGSSIVAARAARNSSVLFSEFIINDEVQKFVSATEQRLARLRTVPKAFVGDAAANIDQIVSALPPYGFTVAFIDPFNLVPFQVLQRLSELRRIDLIIHYSTADIQRNLLKYFGNEESQLEAFAPGVTSMLAHARQDIQRQKVFEYWLGLLTQLGFSSSKTIPLVRGSKNQRLYQLVHFSREPIADRLWNAAADTDAQRGFEDF